MDTRCLSGIINVDIVVIFSDLRHIQGAPKHWTIFSSAGWTNSTTGKKLSVCLHVC